MVAAHTSLFRFGGFVLDVAERQLLAHGQSVALTPKVFETLVLLVDRAGHVVSKEELMSALWPRGFVDESNLTKHIWTIRKALADHDGGECRIETVPKLGYRFVATMLPVSLGDSAINDAGESEPTLRSDDCSVDDQSLAVPAAPARVESLPVAPAVAATDVPIVVSPARRPVSRSRRILWFAAALALVVVLATATMVRWRHATTAGVMGVAPPGRSLAIVEFNNLSQNAKDAWLAPALVEMLATEIALDGDLHTVPGELVRGAERDLPAVLAGGFAPQSLDVLRRRLASDFVLSGSYLVSGSGDDARLRVDLALQDVRNGKMLATLSRNTRIGDLTTLVTATGEALRQRLGAHAPSAAALAATAGAQPPTPDVARRIGFALDALHRFDAAHARDELLEVVAEAPSYAPAYSYLAQAWSMLGYKAKALAAARQAAAHAGDLPQQQRAEIDVQVHRAEFDWPATVAALRTLVAAAPSNPEYRLQLVDALLSAGKVDGAAQALAGLRTQAAPDDPRVELAATHVAVAQNNIPAAATHAARALEQAKARGDGGLIADAEVAAALAKVGNIEQIQQLLRTAIADYERIGNPHGEAYARQNLANALWDGNDAKAARSQYENAMAIYQRIGDRNGIAAIYSNLARMDWAVGDRDAAVTAAQHALSLRRETGDLQGQAWNLTALATMESDESADDRVVDLYRQALILDKESGDQGHQVFVLASLADLLRMRGDLDEAIRTCTEAEALAGTLANADAQVQLRISCSQTSLAVGDVQAAKQGLENLIGSKQAIADVGTVPNVQLILAAIAQGAGDWAGARQLLVESIAGWKKSDSAAGEAVAQSQLALCEDALGNPAARDRARERALFLRKGIDERGEMFALDVAVARLDGTQGETALRELAEDSGKRVWVENVLEAKLALYAVQSAPTPRGDRGAGALATAEEIRKLASTHGFKWDLARLDDARVASEHERKVVGTTPSTSP